MARPTLRGFLAEIGRAAATVNIECMRTYIDVLLRKNTFDAKVQVYDQTVEIDGVAFLPHSVPQLARLKVSGETEISVPRSVKRKIANGGDTSLEEVALKMELKRGLFKRSVTIRYEAEFNIEGGGIQAFELLRDRANEGIRELIMDGE